MLETIKCKGSNKLNLFHNTHKFVLTDLAVSIRICRSNHTIDGIIIKVEEALVQHVAYLGAVEVSRIIFVKMSEYL